MESVLQKLADLKKDHIYKASKISPRLYTVKEHRNADFDGFGDEDEWDQVGSWNYVSIIEKFDEEKEENGTIPTLIFAPSSKSLLGFIDLNRLEVVDRNTGIARIAESTFMDEEKTKLAPEEEYSNLPIVPCVHPVGLFHMTVVLHPDQNLPQLIGPDVVEDIFLIAAIFLPASGAVLGFNSLNAGAASNRLHVELLLSPSFSTPASSGPNEPGWPAALPILQSKGEIIFMGRLPGEEDYADYSVLVELSKHQDPDVRWFRLEFKEPQIPDDGDEVDLATVYASIVSFAISELVGLRVPHNIVWLNSGKTILIFARKPDLKFAKWGWPEMVGLNRFSETLDKGNPCADEKQFTEITEAFKTYLVQKLFANSNEPN